MDKGIHVLSIADAEVAELEGGKLISRRLVRRAHGSQRASFNVTTIHEGFDDRAIRYEGHDEIFYVIAGEAEIDFDGGRHVLKPGMAVFVPEGCTYGYRVLRGPNEVVAVFTPARA